MRIAVDTMSGDHGPEPAVIGAALAIRELDTKIILVGDVKKIERELDFYKDVKSNVEIIESTEIITMEDSPAKAIRTKKNASVVIAANLVKDSKAVGFFSPGNTGATMAAALTILGRLKGVKRPAIAAPIPREDGKVSLLLDAGANVDCKPEYLVQFAIMGEIYAREVMGITNPSIGLLSNGEEDSKGNEITLAALKKIKKLPYHISGNVEGRDFFGAGKHVDVIVCDGFVGNIALKTIEGCAKSIFNILKENIRKSSLAKTGALLLKPAFLAVKNTMDYSSYGGAPLLGANGVTTIGHGSSGGLAVKNAIKFAAQFAAHNVNEKIVQAIERFT
ncbi:MAG: phosphate acyltransferase PlsX [Spirochaetia bacterium]|nr:phosphate acyltransferase PlsX [Spirochaetia bacterium]